MTEGLVMSNGVVSAAQPARSVSMMAKKPLIPKGPFGNYRSPSDSTEDGWVGDRSRGVQIGKFEAGEDYLFFQGPAPKTAIQEDLPSFFSLENLGDAAANLQVTPVRVLIGVAGIGSFGLVGQTVLSAPSWPYV